MGKGTKDPRAKAREERQPRFYASPLFSKDVGEPSHLSEDVEPPGTTALLRGAKGLQEIYEALRRKGGLERLLALPRPEEGDGEASEVWSELGVDDDVAAFFQENGIPPGLIRLLMETGSDYQLTKDGTKILVNRLNPDDLKLFVQDWKRFCDSLGQDAPSGPRALLLSMHENNPSLFLLYGLLFYRVNPKATDFFSEMLSRAVERKSDLSSLEKALKKEITTKELVNFFSPLFEGEEKNTSLSPFIAKTLPWLGTSPDEIILRHSLYLEEYPELGQEIVKTIKQKSAHHRDMVALSFFFKDIPSCFFESSAKDELFSLFREHGVRSPASVREAMLSIFSQPYVSYDLSSSWRGLLFLKEGKGEEKSAVPLDWGGLRELVALAEEEGKQVFKDGGLTKEGREFFQVWDFPSFCVKVKEREKRLLWLDVSRRFGGASSPFPIIERAMQDTCFRIEAPETYLRWADAGIKRPEDIPLNRDFVHLSPEELKREIPSVRGEEELVRMSNHFGLSPRDMAEVMKTRWGEEVLSLFRRGKGFPAASPKPFCDDSLSTGDWRKALGVWSRGGRDNLFISYAFDLRSVKKVMAFLVEPQNYNHLRDRGWTPEDILEAVEKSLGKKPGSGASTDKRVLWVRETLGLLTSLPPRGTALFGKGEEGEKRLFENMMLLMTENRDLWKNPFDANSPFHPDNRRKREKVIKRMLFSPGLANIPDRAKRVFMTKTLSLTLCKKKGSNSPSIMKTPVFQKEENVAKVVDYLNVWVEEKGNDAFQWYSRTEGNTLSGESAFYHALYRDFKKDLEAFLRSISEGEGGEERRHDEYLDDFRSFIGLRKFMKRF